MLNKGYVTCATTFYQLCTLTIGREFCKIKTRSKNVQQANGARADCPENFRVRRGRRLEAPGPLANSMFVCQTCIILTKTVHFGQINAIMSSGLILPVPYYIFTLSENDGCRPSILGGYSSFKCPQMLPKTHSSGNYWIYCIQDDQRSP